MSEQLAQCDCLAPHCPAPFYSQSRDAKALRRFKDLLLSLNPRPSFEEIIELLDREIKYAAARLQAEHEAKVIQTFPNLISFPPGMNWREVLLEFKRSSVLTGEIKRFRGMQDRLRQAASLVPKDQSKSDYREAVLLAQERALYELFIPKYSRYELPFDEAQILMSTAINNVKTHLDIILREYFPINRFHQLRYSAPVLTAQDMPRLLELITRSRGNGVISKRIPFEARILAVLAQLEFENLIGTHNPDELDRIREDLNQRFEDEVFEGQESQRVIVVAELDPDNNYRVKQDKNGQYAVAYYDENDPRAKMQSTATTFVTSYPARVIRYNGSKFLVHFDSRRKERIFAKQLRKTQRKPEQITDLSGYTVVLLDNNLEHEEYLADRLRQTIVNCPGLVSAQQSNASRAGAIDPENPHSSPNRRGEKYEFLWIIWHELQILALPDYINSLVAHAQDGHPFYKLITYLDTLFPWIWPAHLYGMDWSDPKIRDILWHHQCRHLQPA
ncbi:MAG: hypothetical protein ACOYUZ_00700 [Patescibacteria group bacterium]